MKVCIEKKIPHILKNKVIEFIKNKEFFKEYLVNNTLEKQFDLIEEHGKILVLYIDEKPEGFLSGFLIDSFFYNQKGVYTPEWASFFPEDVFSKVTLFKSLYEEMKKEGYTHHIQSNINKDIDSFFVDFAYSCILKDGARQSKVNGTSLLKLEPVSSDNMNDYLDMCKEHETYMSSSPIYLGEGFNLEETLQHVSQNKDLYYVKDKNKKVGFTTLSDTEKAGSELLKTKKSLAVKGTHILSKYQNSGYGKELIKAINDFAIEKEYTYIVTDFETYNMKAHLFWPKHFNIVMKTYMKYIGE